MKNLTLYIGVEYNDTPHPVIFKKMSDELYTKKQIIAFGKKLSQGIAKLTYLAGFDKNGKIKTAHDFQLGDWCGELSLHDLDYVVL